MLQKFPQEFLCVYFRKTFQLFIRILFSRMTWQIPTGVSSVILYFFRKSCVNCVSNFSIFFFWISRVFFHIFFQNFSKIPRGVSFKKFLMDFFRNSCMGSCWKPYRDFLRNPSREAFRKISGISSEIWKWTWILKKSWLKIF